MLRQGRETHRRLQHPAGGAGPLVKPGRPVQPVVRHLRHVIRPDDFRLNDRLVGGGLVDVRPVAGNGQLVGLRVAVGADPDRQRHRIDAVGKIDVFDGAAGRGLAVAEIPLGRGPGRRFGFADGKFIAMGILIFVIAFTGVLHVEVGDEVFFDFFQRPGVSPHENAKGAAWDDFPAMGVRALPGDGEASDLAAGDVIKQEIVPPAARRVLALCVILAGPRLAKTSGLPSM